MLKEEVIDWICQNQEQFTELSDKVWDYAESAFQEFRSVKLLADTLENEGFEVQRAVAEMETAFVATYGTGKPVIGILGEYDALPGLSQKVQPLKEAFKVGTNGHGCGHNLLGVAGIAAVLAIKQLIDEKKISGTIRYYGCPAEEQFNAKGYMVKHGLFDDTDIALTWHPWDVNGIMNMPSNAIISVIFKFNGKTAHAAGDPYNGRSALDAVELTNVGCNYLREHMMPSSRLHYIITNGGEAPNIVPDRAEVWYYVRAPKYQEAHDLYKRVIKVAKGAAMMTETELEIDYLGGTYNTSENMEIYKVLDENMQFIGAPEWSDEDKEFAMKIREGIPESSIGGLIQQFSGEIQHMARELYKKPLCDVILPIFGDGQVMPGSTDVGDVSWVVPLGEFLAATAPLGTPGHSWQNVASGRMGIGHKGMIFAAKTLATTAIDFMQNEELVKKAWDEFNETHREEKYVSPFSKGEKPPFHRLTEDKLQFPDIE